MPDGPLPHAQPMSGIGSARPTIQHSATGGAGPVGQIPTLNPSQFGAAPNWASSPVAQASSAMQLKEAPGA